MPRARTSTVAADGGGYTRDLRWGYRVGYGEGTFPEPYRGGGSYGRGYDWAEDRAPDIRQGGAPREQEPARAHTRLSRRRRHRRRHRAQRPWRHRRGSRDERAAYEAAAYETAAYEAAAYEAAVYEAAAYDAAYGPRYASAGPYRRRLRRPWRAGTAERDYDRAYPYFASAAALEASSGYPPGETLSPDTLPRRAPNRTFYGDGC